MPDLIETGNINLTNRPVVKNADGTWSTVRSVYFETPQGVVVVPTVSDDGRIMSNSEAWKRYQLTGKHLGIFGSTNAAELFSRKLHEEQERAYTPIRGLERYREPEPVAPNLSRFAMYQNP
jgi:hypothetical protein